MMGNVFTTVSIGVSTASKASFLAIPGLIQNLLHGMCYDTLLNGFLGGITAYNML